MSLVKPTILVDADVLAYAAAAATEVEFEWEPGYYTWYTPFEDTKTQILAAIEEIKDTFHTTSVVLCLTSPHNFRKAILPTYKAHRSDKRKPLVLKSVREWLLTEHDAKMVDGLEGDDLMGIYATRTDGLPQSYTVILSPDKDMQQIPGKLCKALGEEVIEIYEEEARIYHLLQTLTGDQADGYGGCPGIGPVKATKILEQDSTWESIVATYEKAGLTEADALTQARVSRICRAEDYDFQTKSPILWSPK